MPPTGPLVLAGEFPPAERESWLELVAAALRKGSPDAAMALLRSTTYDDLTIEPLYTRADAVDPDTIGRPGEGPLVRGRTPVEARSATWDVRQIVDASAGAPAAVEELERGATSIWLHVDPPGDDVEGVVDGALEGVLLDVAPVVLAAGRTWHRAAAVLAARWDRDGISPAPGGSLGADPLGSWASARRQVDPDAEMSVACDWAARLADRAPGVRAFTIDGTRYHDAGASDAQELGFTVAAAVSTVRALDGLADPFRAIELRLAATADQFATIAKFRAVRRLWARVAEAAGAGGAAMGTPLHAVTSAAMTTRYEPAVNMLRNTVACFAAGVAGVDAITVTPYDALVAGTATELGRRLARNTQSVLALESHLPRVADPAGGSWYVERLTDELAASAWSIVQDVERAGGFRAAVESGLVGERIATVRARRDADVDHRRAPLTGVSEFPNVFEPPPPPSEPVVRATDGSLPRHRWSERFEQLRARVDAHAAACGRRPAVYLATLGSPADFTARLTFAKGFFEVAGLATVAGPVGGFAGSTASVACLCSSDARYAEAAQHAVVELEAAGARRVYVAGQGDVVAGADARAALAEVLEVMDIA